MAAVLRVAEIEGKGRGVVAARAVKGGEILLRDSPILLYDASPEDEVPNHCARCFRSVVGIRDGVKCGGGHGRCNRVFCGAECSAALGHTGWACTALSEAAKRVTGDDLVEARFLVAAYTLAPPELSRLAALRGKRAAVGPCSAVELEGWGPETVAELIGKERENAFGLMEPMGDGSGERKVRAYGIYGAAALFNHDCLPNACRFDYLETGNPEVVIRAIHDIEEGREICLSYFPVNLGYAARQARLRDDYGFVCDCDRCKVEALWPEDGDDDDASAAMDDDEDDDDDDAMDDGDDDVAFPHAYFFGRYMCELENCGGTLAPLPPELQSQPFLTMECNVCGWLTSLPN